MFSADLVVGARGIAELERAVRDALDELDLRVIDDATVADGRARGDLVTSGAARARVGAAIEAPSLAFGLISERSHVYTVNVRGPRTPLWHFGLTQRLSLALGGWAASRVNDRLHDDYGYGIFLAGHAVEAAMRSIGGLVLRLGIDPRVSTGQLYDALDEDVNTERFRTLATRLADDRAAWTWPPSGEIRVLLLATKTGAPIDSLDDDTHRVLARLRERRSPLGVQPPDDGGLPWLAPSAAPRVIGTLAGLTADECPEMASALRGMGVRVETFDVDPTYDVLPDGSLDEAPVSVLLLGATPPVRAADVLDAPACAAACPAAIIELGSRMGEVDAWARPRGGPFVRLENGGVDALARAWGHVTKRTARSVMRWTFPDVGAIGHRPYR